MKDATMTVRMTQETKKAIMLADNPHAEWLDHQSLKSLWSAKLEN